MNTKEETELFQKHSAKLNNIIYDDYLSKLKLNDTGIKRKFKIGNKVRYKSKYYDHMFDNKTIYEVINITYLGGIWIKGTSSWSQQDEFELVEE